MWTPATRERHSRSEFRCSTDLSDAERDVLAPLLPTACRLGRPGPWSMRETANGIFSVLRGGLPWRLPPKDLPPKSTVHGYFGAWRDSGLFAGIDHHLVMLDRERVGREASPPLASPAGFACLSLKPASPGAAVLDSQSVRTTESGGPRGYDARAFSFQVAS